MNRQRLAPWFVTGLLEGEGTFTYSRSGRQLLVVFMLRRPAADAALLERLRRFFGGIGKLYRIPARTATARTPSTTCCWKVTRPAELLRLLDHLDRFPFRGEKRKTYAIWREMVAIRAAYHRSPPPRELQDLAAALSAAVAAGRSR